MNKKVFALFLVIICTLFNTVAQFFIKSASASFAFDLSLFTNVNLIIGGVFYSLSLVAYMYALKSWELSSLAPSLSLQYIFVAMMSYYLFNEEIALVQMMGLFFIILGVGFIAREAKA